jgi:hypothetical protein
VPNGVTVTGTGLANPVIVQQEAGIMLMVTPRISPDGQIVMQLVAEKSSYDFNNGVPIFTDASNGNVVTAPTKNISTAIATVSVPNGQTVVIGGLITSSDDRLTRKVPWLGDIPVLGYAFRYDARSTVRKELLIFLTPRLIREDFDSELIKDIEIARMHFIESDAEEIHGPLRGVPAELPITDEEVPWIESDGTILPLPTVPAVPAKPPAEQGEMVPPPNPAGKPSAEETDEVPPPKELDENPIRDLSEPMLPMPDAPAPDPLLRNRRAKPTVLQAGYEEESPTKRPSRAEKILSKFGWTQKKTAGP